MRHKFKGFRFDPRYQYHRGHREGPLCDFISQVTWKEAMSKREIHAPNMRYAAGEPVRSLCRTTQAF